ncbi:MAG: 6-carboxytetrahydropterin synthase [Acidobacteriia bacterium]|nr:6-carboxytetrahydropterin synthase [Terriglobia bacterium]
MFEISVEYSFAAGHALRGYKGKCENVHGHNYRVRITVAGDQLNSIGLLMEGDGDNLSHLRSGGGVAGNKTSTKPVSNPRGPVHTPQRHQDTKKARIQEPEGGKLPISGFCPLHSALLCVLVS